MEINPVRAWECSNAVPQSVLSRYQDYMSRLNASRRPAEAAAPATLPGITTGTDNSMSLTDFPETLLTRTRAFNRGAVTRAPAPHPSKVAQAYRKVSLSVPPIAEGYGTESRVLGIFAMGTGVYA